MDGDWDLRPGADAYTRVPPSSSAEPLQRRKRIARSPSPDTLFTARDVRETCVSAYRPRRKLSHAADALTPHASFDMPQGVTRRLAERASPRSPTLPRHYVSTPALRAQRAALSGVLPYSIPDTLPLTPEGAHMLELHIAIEQCLLVHMATCGAPGTEFTDEPMGGRLARRVRIPNIISFSALRPMVERAARRSMQPDDFRRVVWVWSNAVTQADWASELDEMPPAQVNGMGFLVTRTRTTDGRRKGYDWGIGIELWYNRPAPPPLEVAFGPQNNNVSPSTPPRRRGVATPPASPKSPKSPNRSDMSNIAVWNHGLEERRTEFMRRLRTLTALAHHHWAIQTHQDEDVQDAIAPGVRAAHGALARMMDGHSGASKQEPLLESPAIEFPATPQSTRIPASYQLGPGGILTPGATRSGKHAQRIAHGPVDMPESPLAHKSASRPVQQLCDWHPDFMAASEALAIVPLARLPMLQAVPRASELEPTQPKPTEPAPPAEPVPTRLSLEERIRAKEEARKHVAAQPGHAPVSLKHQAVLSRLGEFADALYLLFTTSPVPIMRSRSGAQSSKLPLVDVLGTLEQSSKISLGRRESRDAVKTLMSLAPGWLDITSVGGVEWLCLRNDPANGCGLRNVRDRITQAAADARVR